MSAVFLTMLCLSACAGGQSPEPSVVTIDSFCLTKQPWRPTDADLAATPPAVRREKLADNEYGERECGWKP